MKYTYIDFAVEVLSNSDRPLTHQEIWEIGQKEGLVAKLGSLGNTPWNTLSARLYVTVKDDSKSKIIRVGNRPIRFYLSSKKDTINENTIEDIEKSESKLQLKSSYKEKDLHPLLSYFAYSNASFSRGRNILTKTIDHQKSKKSGYNEWIHPDLVGFYLPLDEWQSNLIDFNRIADNNALKLFSFELKKSLNGRNYRESFFQAVSNSSWANEGYLVAAEIKQDDHLLSELERLSVSFGIGIIHLNLDDIDSSRVLYSAKTRPLLDWETMNKLSEQNSGFQKFLNDVKIDFDSKRIHKSEYDSIIKEPEEYIKKIRK